MNNTDTHQKENPNALIVYNPKGPDVLAMIRARAKYRNALVVYKPRKPVTIASFYVCGNLHRIMFVPVESDGRGGHDWCAGMFDTVLEAMTWAFVENRPVNNLLECEMQLAYGPMLYHF